MDSPPRMPQHCRPLVMGRSATNEVPKSICREREERLTPPLEIFVVRDPLSSLSGHSKSGGGVSPNDSAITLDYSMMESSTVLNCNLSVTSDISSIVDQVHQQHHDQKNHKDIIHPTMAGSGTSGDRCRLPPRRQSSRRPRSSRKGVMRWASMPMSNLHSNKNNRQERDNSTDDDDHNSPTEYSTGLDCSHTIDTPRLPQRRDSNPSIFSSDEEDEDEEEDNTSNQENDDTTNNKKMNNNSDKEMPRLPTRKKSNESLFSTTKVKASSSAEGSCGGSSNEVVVGAHAA